MGSYKLISLLFPFVKEMVLGEKTLREALKTNKMRVFLIFLIMFSFFCNIFFIPKLIRVSTDWVILEKKYKELQHEKQICPEPPKPSVEHKRVIVEKPSVPIPASEPESVPSPVPDATTPDDTPVDHPYHRPSRPIQRQPHHATPTREASTPAQTETYLEWKKSFDDIRAKEDHDNAVGNGDIYNRH